MLARVTESTTIARRVTVWCTVVAVAGDALIGVLVAIVVVTLVAIPAFGLLPTRVGTREYNGLRWFDDVWRWLHDIFGRVDDVGRWLHNIFGWVDHVGWWVDNVGWWVDNVRGRLDDILFCYGKFVLLV